ncbi:MAG: CPBP family intramembrane metalloprotease [Bacteroidales bacterium]|jgi:membrane protease YdiL (CAAX protease family)|nr:CPBP family intramembrane metalloprotease [Bacteroidales bacterium]
MFRNSNFAVKLILFIALLVCCFIVFSGGFALIATAVWKDVDLMENIHYLRFTQIVGTIGMFLIPALLFSYFVDNKFFTFSLSHRFPPKKMAAIVLLLSIFIIPLIAYIGVWNEKITLPESMTTLEQHLKVMEEQARLMLAKMTGDYSYSSLFINLFIMALLPAIAEEFLFRGTLQPLINSKIKNHHLSIWISAIVFSIIHFQFYGFFPRMLLGAYLGYLAVWGGSLWLPILAHFLHNCLSVVMDFSLMRSGIDTEMMPEEFTATLLPMAILSLIVVSFGTFLLWKRRVDLS